jgi:cytochrome c oxidase cbb3-type subunit I/II
VRPLRSETERYGRFSLAGESVYDRPFLFGSRRTGPDLARVGGKYPDSWHWYHLEDPRRIEPRSNMPSFAFLLATPLDTSLTSRKLAVLRRLGHPYGEREIANAGRDALAQAGVVAARLRAEGVELGATGERSEAVALIAYLQGLGRALREAPPVAGVGGR